MPAFDFGFVRMGVVVSSALLAAMTCGGVAAAAPLPIRVVVVTTFTGANDADAGSEFHAWLPTLPERLRFPLGYHELRYDPKRGVLGIVTGEGAERGAASIMALGCDPRFDLSKAYWVVAAIAGVDPKVASIGSAVWADWVVNADLAFEIDARDVPRSWSTGIVPFFKTTPFAEPPPAANSPEGQFAYRLNPKLAQWALDLTKDTHLPDNPKLAAERAPYAGTREASRPPFVTSGATLSGDRYWIGSHMMDWAERWVSYWTGGAGRFATTAEEDAGILQSLTFLSHAKRADIDRVLVLRTASDYAAPPPGRTAAELLASDAGTAGEPGDDAAFVAAYAVGSRVVDELVRHWERYGASVP